MLPPFVFFCVHPISSPVYTGILPAIPYPGTEPGRQIGEINQSVYYTRRVHAYRTTVIPRQTSDHSLRTSVPGCVRNLGTDHRQTRRLRYLGVPRPGARSCCRYPDTLLLLGCVLSFVSSPLFSVPLAHTSICKAVIYTLRFIPRGKEKREEYNNAVKNRAGNFDPEFFRKSAVRTPHNRSKNPLNFTPPKRPHTPGTYPPNGIPPHPPWGRSGDPMGPGSGSRDPAQEPQNLCHIP